VANMCTIYLDIHDLDSAEAARNELEEYLHAAEADLSPVETPLLAAKSMRSLWDSDVPTDTFIAEALDELRAVKQERRRRDQHSSPTEATSQTLAELSRSRVSPSATAITVPGVNGKVRPSTSEFGADLFASTREPEPADEHDALPQPGASSRKSRKSDRDVSRHSQ
jgi:hypothetical protein